MTPAPAAFRKVLLIDEDCRQRQTLAHEISQMEFEVCVAGTPEAARRALREGAFDIVVVEPFLPGSDGPELLMFIRHEHPMIEIVVLTAFGDLDTAKQAIHADVADFLTKPAQLCDLEQALNRSRQRAMRTHPRLPQLGCDSTPSAPLDGAQKALCELSLTHPLSLTEVEHHYIMTVLQKHNGNRARTAAELGISLRKLYYRLHQYVQEEEFALQTS